MDWTVFSGKETCHLLKKALKKYYDIHYEGAKLTSL